jgi:tetratricopeptide (TPR) repeat protein
VGAPDDNTAGEPPGEGAADAPSRRTGRLKPKIAVSLATLVVIGATLAILQTEASINESNSARETTRVAVRAMSANVLAAAVANTATALQAQSDFLPFRRPLDRSIPSLAAAAGLSTPPGRAAADRKIARSAVPALGLAKMLDSLRTDAQRLTLKQQALATTRITWNDRSTQYTTVIAVLAAALFLVGFGLVVEGSIQGSSYALGIIIGAFAVAWAIWIYLLPIPSTPDVAINAAARGAVLSAAGRYQAAIAQYDRALGSDGGYAVAYTGRARARLLAANPDYPVTRAFTDAGGRITDEAVLDARRALDHGGGRDLLTVGLLALTHFYRGHYEQAVAGTDRALGINDGVPDVWLLRSAAQLALGDTAGAGASFERALAPLRGTVPSAQTRLLASTYLSYLGWVARRVPAEAPAAQELADRVVARETAFTLGHPVSGTPPATGSATVERLRYAAGKLTLRLRWTNLPKGTALSGIAYERPLPDGAWAQPAELALFATLEGSGKRDISVAVDRVCKPTEVRVDLYLDGARTHSSTGPGVAATC